MNEDDNTQAWLAENLRIAVFHEDYDGSISCNTKARELMGQHPVSSIESVLGTVADLQQSELGNRIVELGRAGSRGTFLLEAKPEFGSSSWQVLVLPFDRGWQLWLCPAALHQSYEVQKRATMADAAASVSHEISNALTAILGWAQMGQASPKLPEAANKAFSYIEQSATAANAVTRAMLEASGNGMVRNNEIDLSTLLEQLRWLLLPTAIKARVSLEFDVESGLYVRCSRTDLWTVAWNLTKNAIEACEGTGMVNVSAKRVDGMIELRVKDNGPGMSPDVERESFVPYFTTKANGTGLGLALVKKALEHMSGQLELISQPKEGSCFIVTLPCSETRAATPLRNASSGIRRSEKPIISKVLVVENDFALKELIATSLSLRGTEVTAVRSGHAALELQDCFDVAVIDMVLDDMRGDELLSKLRASKLVERAILVSGHPQPADLCEGGAAELWLRKPYDIDAMMTAIEDLRNGKIAKIHTA